MKALTLWQPWASLVALGVKTIETRSWSTSYRGDLAIHAAQRPPAVGVSAAVSGWSVGHHRLRYHDHVDEGYTLTRLGQEPTHRMPLGAIVATADLVDVVPILAAGQWLELAWAKHVAPAREGGPLWLWLGPSEIENGSTGRPTWRHKDIEAQRPFGDYTPGRYAWLLDNIEPLADPAPARGRQQLWEWA